MKISERLLHSRVMYIFASPRIKRSVSFRGESFLTRREKRCIHVYTFAMMKEQFSKADTSGKGMAGPAANHELVLYEFMSLLVRIAFQRANPTFGNFNSKKPVVPVPDALQAIRRELMPLRYAAITMRRHEVPELAALQTVVRLSGRPQQRLFADADSYELREAEARQEALVESLHATIAAGEALQNEVGAHAAWQQSTYSAQLTTLGCVLSVLGLCSVSFDALAFVQGLQGDGGALAAAVRWLKVSFTSATVMAGALC